jgi:hypothetical protein
VRIASSSWGRAVSTAVRRPSSDCERRRSWRGDSS